MISPTYNLFVSSAFTSLYCPPKKRSGFFSSSLRSVTLPINSVWSPSSYTDATSHVICAIAPSITGRPSKVAKCTVSLRLASKML